MSQLVLDPRNATTEGLWRPRVPIPPPLRGFGRFPNTDGWLPGDLVLFSKVEPGLNQRAVMAAQERGGFDVLDARWQHAAVYLGEDGLCEATRAGVRVGSVLEYAGSHLLRVRRPGLDVHDQYRLCIKALTRLPDPYDFLGALSVGLLSLGGLWKPGLHAVLPPASGPVICSQLYAWSYQQVTGQFLIKPDPGRPLTPADLSLTANLRDIPAVWRQIVHG